LRGIIEKSFILSLSILPFYICPKLCNWWKPTYIQLNDPPNNTANINTPKKNSQRDSQKLAVAHRVIPTA